MANGNNFKKLMQLNISNIKMTKKGIQLLVGINLHLLTELNISNNMINNEGFKILASKSYWPILIGLKMSNTLLYNRIMWNR